MVKDRKIKRKTFDPVKEQIEMLLEYINILEKKKDANLCEEITYLISLIMTVKQQCVIYLSNELKNKGQENGRNYSF